MMLLEALFGWVTAGTGTVAVRRIWTRLAGTEAQRALAGVIPSAVQAAVDEVAPADMRGEVGAAVREQLDHRVTLAVEDAADPIRTVRCWLDPLADTGYLARRGVDADVLAEHIAQKIVREIMESLHSVPALRQVGEEIRHAEVIGGLDRVMAYLARLERGLRADGRLDAEGSSSDGGYRSMVPPRQPPVITRRGPADRIRELLCSDDVAQVAMSTALRGTGGFGKTTLAVELGHDPRILDRFPGGVLWVELGQGNRSDLSLATKLYDLAAWLDPEASREPDLQRAKRAVTRRLGTAPTLLIVDDVWTQMQSGAFTFGVTNCATLFTTRIGSCVPGAQAVPVDEMTEEESRALLTAGLGLPPDAASGELLRLTGRWPLLLALANRQARQLVDLGNPPAQALGAVEEQLREGGPDALEMRNVEHRNHAVAASVQISLDFLAERRPSDVERYLRLAVFDEAYQINQEVLEKWWGLDRVAVRTLCRDLADLSLVQRFEVPASVRLHDVIREHLLRRVGAGRVQKLKAELVDLLDEHYREGNGLADW